MSSTRHARLEDVIALCLEARGKLGPDVSFRVRTLLDMLLFDLGRELAGSRGETPPGDAPPSDRTPDRS